MGFYASRKNPNVCGRCMEAAPEGGAVVPVTILFADVRGYTSMAERSEPVEVTALVRRFYEAASRALLRHEAVLATIAGDEVMAVFVRGFAGALYPKRAVEGARSLLEAVGYGGSQPNWLDVGIGISTGEDYVGNVGGGGFKDFTALGDTTNTAARLQAVARGGEIMLDAATYAVVADAYPGAERLELELKGKQEPVEGFRLRFPTGAR
jgi:adenylate cyclase